MAIAGFSVSRTSGAPTTAPRKQTEAHGEDETTTRDSVSRKDKSGK